MKYKQYTFGKLDGGGGGSDDDGDGGGDDANTGNSRAATQIFKS